MGSSRLYGKILYPLHGIPLLGILMERIKGAAVKQWWLATTEEKEDDLTANWGKALGLRVFRGSSDDVLSRFINIIGSENPDYVVRITADDPFIDSKIINLMLEQAYTMSSKYSLLSAGSTLPLGYVPGVFIANDLVQIESEIPAEQPFHRSHVVSWFTVKNMEKTFSPPDNWPTRANWRWTVDTIEDAHMAEAAFNLFGSQWATITYPDIVFILDKHPDVTSINLRIRQKTIDEG